MTSRVVAQESGIPLTLFNIYGNTVIFESFNLGSHIYTGNTQTHINNQWARELPFKLPKLNALDVALLQCLKDRRLTSVIGHAHVTFVRLLLSHGYSFPPTIALNEKVRNMGVTLLDAKQLLVSEESSHQNTFSLFNVLYRTLHVLHLPQKTAYLQTITISSIINCSGIYGGIQVKTQTNLQ